MNFRTAILRASLACALTSFGFAQSFNVDVGANIAFPTPPMGFPGAAGQPGWWNPVDGAAVNVFLRNLMNITTLARVSVAGGNGNFEFDHPGTFGAFEDLLDDAQDVGPGGVPAFWTFTNLQNGLYEVTTYAWAPDSATYVTNVTAPCSSDAPELVGGGWAGVFVRGDQYAVHRIAVTSGTFTIEVRSQSGSATVNGFQLKKLEPAGIPGCFGDGTDWPCPCGNFGLLGRGCENSFGTGGGLLEGFGEAVVSADTLMLAATHMPPTAPMLFFQGTAPIGGGGGVFGAPFGDGLRCVGGVVVRLADMSSVCGSSSYPRSSDASISVLGGIPAAGGVRFYQAWYRNVVAFCTPDGFNLTNGLQITWVP
jgi:hypothetical protein